MSSSMMRGHQCLLGAGLFFLSALIFCGRPVSGEGRPAREESPEFSSEVQGIVDLSTQQEAFQQPNPDHTVVKVEGHQRGESLEEMKERTGFDKVWPSEVYARDFVGVKKCSLCHNKKDRGDQVKIWQDTTHAKAFYTLGTPEAKALADKLGVADPQQSGKCLRCHSTAYGFGEQMTTGSIPPEEGVSCESCHGPGKDYMKLKVMKDREQAKAAGLIVPDEQTCLKCHNETAPNVKPFNFKESWPKIRHPIP